MKSLPFEVDIGSVSGANIGIVGENAARAFRYDISEFKEQFGLGTVTILHKRPKDSYAYPVGNVTVENNIVTWVPGSADLEQVGKGKLTLIYTVGTTVAKTLLFDTYIRETIGDEQNAPHPVKYYLDQVIAAAATVSDAEAYATGKRGGIDVEEDDPAYHNNAPYYAGVAGDAADVAAAAAVDALAAQGAAETAQGKAEDAQSAAETAQGKAEDAQTAAETAQGKAETAQGKAEDAQTAAETAQGKAEDAQQAAETAEDAAEDYAKDSEAYATGKRAGADVSSSDPAYHNNALYYKDQAAGSATNAAQSASDASGSATAASGSATAAAGSATAASGSASAASGSAGQAAGSATAADGSAKDAEAYAVGKRGGTDVPSTDPAYENNAKFYAGKAAEYAAAAQSVVDSNFLLVDKDDGNKKYIVSMYNQDAHFHIGLDELEE